MRKIMQYLSLLLLILISNNICSEQILFEFEKNRDQKIEHISSSNETILINKQYLEQGKIPINSLKNENIIYELINTKIKKNINIISTKKETNIKIGKLKYFDNEKEYIIPVIVNNKKILFHTYSLKNNNITLSKYLPIIPEGTYVKNIYLLSKGYMVVSLVNNRSTLTYYNYSFKKDTAKEIKIKLKGIDGFFLVDDIIEMNDKIYIAIKTLKNSMTSSIITFNKNFMQQKKYQLDIGNAKMIQVRFIETSHNNPSIQVLKNEKIFSPPTISIYKINSVKSIKNIQLNYDGIMNNYSIVGICKDEYVFAGKFKPKSSRTMSSIVFINFDSKGKERKTWVENRVDYGSISDISLKLSKDYFLSAVNFTQLEDVRRKDGWYSWAGYRLDKHPISCK